MYTKGKTMNEDPMMGERGKRKREKVDPIWPRKRSCLKVDRVKDGNRASCW